MKKNYPSYEEAKKIVMDNGVKTIVEYKAIYKKLGLPAHPEYTYKGVGWSNWTEFFGGEKKVYPSYEEAKKIIMKNGIKYYAEYKSAHKVLCLPSCPENFYKSTGWKNWAEFLDREKKVYPSYEEAKKIVMENGIKSENEYKTAYKDIGLPSTPSRYYKNKGWTTQTEFFGGEKKVYPSYEKAKKIVMDNGIKTPAEYLSIFKTLGLPSNPSRYYIDIGWTNWTEFLGKVKKMYPSYEEAKKIVMDNGVYTQKEYKSVCKDLGLPPHPEFTYKDKGWNSWTEFWGNEKKVYPSYEEAKKMVFENGIKSKKDYHSAYIDLGLPSHPAIFYKDKGWIDSYDFFGTPKPISSSARKTKVYTTLSISPVLLEDNAPLQIVYMLASQIDKKLASEIEELLNTASCEDRLNMVKEQLKSLKTDTEPMSVSPRESAIGELSAMESMMDVFEDTLDSLSEDTTEYLNNIIKNYYHNATNRALIAEYDD